MAERGKILPLTSVRFIAAFLIVLAHSSASGLFGFQFTERTHYIMGAGVSFFFVLSGFIITYTYGRLDSRADIMRFWGARFSRIWPTHALTFLLCIALLPTSEWAAGGPAALPALANITLTQAMIPVPQYYFSFNAPSWSISTEAYFYLFYPLAALALAWRAWTPVAVGATGVAVMIGLSLILHLPSFSGDSVFKATSHGMMMANPVARFFEFSCGMAAAALWPYFKSRSPSMSATLLEIAAAALAIVSIVLLQDAGAALEARHVPDAITLWVRLGASAIPFAAFILVLSLDRGLIAKLLSVPALVVLGEVSFAMYMLHQLGLRTLARMGWHANGPDWIKFAAFCLLMIVLSYMVWVWIERPSRRLLNQLFRRWSRASG